MGKGKKKNIVFLSWALRAKDREKNKAPPAEDRG